MYCQKGPNGQNSQKCLKGGQCSHQRHEHISQMSATYLNNCNNNPSMDQTVDRTPCGSATPSTPHFDESYDTPPYIRWSQDFHYLINDSEGIQLFQNYLKSEGLEQLLDFWFACEGLKTNETEDKEIIKKLINIIYKKFIRNSKKTIDLSKKVREALNTGLKPVSDPNGLTPDQSPDNGYNPKYDRNVFDSAQQEAEEQLKSSIYVNFLRSDIYLNYLQTNAFPNSHSQTDSAYDKTNTSKGNATNDSSLSSSMESSLEDYNTQSTQYYDVLPTVDEESELQTTDPSANRNGSNAYLRSQTQNRFPSIPVNPCLNLMSSGSNDTLMRGINKILSQRSADSGSIRLTTESHPLSPNLNRQNTAYQSYFRSKSMANPPNPYHVKYATVLPTSARDSELQSMSSHSTNDSMSLSAQEGNETNGIRSKRHQSLAIKHNAKLNSNANHINGNPSTVQLKPPKLDGCNRKPPELLNPEEFAQTLIEKLERLKKERESNQNNDIKLAEVLQLADIVPNANKSNPSVRFPSANTSEKRPLKEVVKLEQLKFEFCPPEDNDQEILDKHFATVFADTPNETPTDSIGRCVSPPKQHNFRAYEHRMTPPVSGPSMGTNHYDPTQVGVTVKYSTEQIPYRLTLTGPHITLRKFKQQIPAKRGNWHYYFKRKCDDRESIDISAPHILEKISDDNALLPLIDGKIFAELQESN